MIADEMKVDKLQTGKKIRSLMKKNGDSVQVLSQRIGLSKSAIRNAPSFSHLLLSRQSVKDI